MSSPPSLGRPRSNSLTTMQRGDALSAGVGMICGLLVFSRNASEFFGGSVVLSFALLALCNEDGELKVPQSSSSQSSPSGLSALLHTVLSWTLLWTTLASLETTTASRWSIPFTLVYGLYFMFRARKEQHASYLVGMSFFGLALCLATSRVFAMYAGPRETVSLAVFWHAVFWSLSFSNHPRVAAISKTRSPKAALMDAPLLGVRDMFRQTKILPIPSSSTSSQKNL